MLPKTLLNRLTIFQCFTADEKNQKFEELSRSMFAIYQIANTLVFLYYFQRFSCHAAQTNYLCISSSDLCSKVV